MKSSAPEERESLKKVESSLEESLKQLATRQKHIKIAGRSDLAGALWPIIRRIC